MATATLSPPPDFLPVPGQPTIPWPRWLRSFLLYMDAAGLSGEADDRQKAILLHCLGAEGQRLYFANVAESDHKKLKTKEVIKKHLTPLFHRTNVAAERSKFRARRQQATESIQEYVASLRELASSCDFKSFEDEMIRDQLTEFTVYPRLREKLTSKVHSLDEAVAAAQEVEDGKRAVKAMQATDAHKVSQVQHNQKGASATTTTAARTQPKKKASETPGRQCYRCGSKQHLANAPDCSARKARCRSCGIVGHFEKVCRRARSVREVDDDDDPSAATNTVEILSAEDELKACTKQIVLDIIINKRTVKMLVDTGASVSIINSQVYNQHFRNNQLYTNDAKLCGYGKRPIPTLGYFTADIQYRKSNATSKVYVTTAGSCVLGMDLFRKLDFAIEYVQEARDEGKILDDYPQLFDGIGTAKGFQHKCQLKPDAVPTACKQRPIPFSLQEELQKEIDVLLKEGIIEPAEHSEWVSPLVITRRKNGGIRLCLDLRQVNKAIVPVRYPLPNIETLLASIHSAKYITKLDLKAAYHQLLLHPDIRELTTFVLPSGVYRFCKAPYGLADLPGSFQKMMDIICAGLEGCLAYLDDVIVWGSTIAEHDARLRAVLDRFARYGITLNPDKCLYRETKVEWLGVSISADGVEITESNASSLRDLPAPSTPAELQSVLGTFQYYSKFIPGFATIVEPLRSLLQASTPATYTWLQCHQAAFNEAKSSLVTLLAFYRPEAETIVTCDASKKGLGAVLSQKQEDGTLRPVAFASRSLSAAEKKYDIGELEALACIYAVERWDRYLHGKPFTLETDHISLVTLLQQSNGTGTKHLRLSRWAARLLKYNFTVKYTKGSQNTVADMFSRMPVAAPSQAHIDDEAAIYAIMAANIQATDFTAASLAAATLADPVLSHVLTYLQGHWPQRTMIQESVLPYYNIREELFIWNDSCLGRGNRAVIPTALQPTLLASVHQSAHMGIVKLKQKIRQLAYWPGIDRDCERTVADCVPCKNSDKSYTTTTTPLKPRTLPHGPWLELGIDIVGPFATAPRGYKFLIVLTDLYSKWPAVHPTDDVTTASVCQFLASLFDTWGLPTSRTPVYHPQANGATERLNRTIKQLLQANIQAGKAWKTAVRDVLSSIRSTPHSTTGKSPFFLMTGREMRERWSTLQPPSAASLDSMTSAEGVRNTVQKKQSAMTQAFNSRNNTKPHQFSVGDCVRIKLPSKSHKLSPTYSQPYSVTAVVGDMLKLSDGKTWHANRIVRSAGTDDAPMQQPATDDGQSSTTPSEKRTPRCNRGCPPARLSDYHVSKP